MKHKSRSVLVLSVFVVFAYLSLNVLLNFTPLREQIVNRLERDTFRNVEISFLYLSWEFRPTVRTIVLERGEPGGGGGTTFELGNVELVLDWTSWWRTRDWGLEKSLRRVLVNSARVRRRMDSSGRDGANEKLHQPTEAMERLPDLPIEVNSWTVRVERDRQSDFELEGRNARYRVGQEPLETEITGIDGDPSDIDFRITDLQPFRAKARVNEATLPDAVWQLEGDRWSGSVNYVKGSDTGTLTVSLDGIPGVVRGQALPEAELASTISTENGVLRVDSFSATSEYLRLTMGRTVNLTDNSVNLSGGYSLRVKERLNRILPDEGENRFRVSTSDTLTGDLAVFGPLSEYSVEGEFHLPRTEFELNRGGFRETVVLEELSGSLDRSGILLNGGTLSTPGRTLRLDDGGFNLEDGEVRTELNGTITDFSFGEKSNGVPARIQRYLGTVESANIPIGFSGRITPDAFTGDFVVKDGRVDFEEGPLRGMRLLVSYSSRPGSPNVVRGEWKDHLGNRWNLTGRTTGPLTIESQLKDVYPLLEKSAWFRTPYLREIRPLNVKLKARVGNPVAPNENYSVRLSFVDSRIEVAEAGYGSFPLGGSLEINEETLDFNDVHLGDPSGEGLSLHGQVRHASNTDTGGWNAKVRTRHFDLSPFLRLGVESQTELDLNAEITGPVSKPEVSARMNQSRVAVRNFQVEDLNAKLSGDWDAFRVQNISGEMSQGRLSGSVEHVPGRESDFDLNLVDFSLPDIFPPESWMGRKTRGRMDLALNLKGNLAEHDSLNGVISGSGRDVVLDHFPEIADIRDVARPSIFEEERPIQPFDFSFPVDSGVVTVRDFRLRSKDIDFNAGGTTKLDGDLSLDMTLVLRGSALKRYLQDVLGDLYRRVGIQAGSKKLKIPLKIKGDIEKPILEIERSKVSKNFRKNLIEDLLTDPIGKPINELIDEIFLFD